MPALFVIGNYYVIFNILNTLCYNIVPNSLINNLLCEQY